MKPFDWIVPIAESRDLRKRCDLEVSSSGASADAIAAAERQLGIKLPPSHRAFLTRWNGGLLGAFGRIFSVPEILAAATETGFRPLTGPPEPVGLAGCADDYYAEKPAHFLLISRHPLGLDGYCLDTRPTATGEFPVCEFDAEDGFAPDKEPAADTFELFLLHEAYDLLRGTNAAPELLRLLLEKETRASSRNKLSLHAVEQEAEKAAESDHGEAVIAAREKACALAREVGPFELNVQCGKLAMAQKRFGTVARELEALRPVLATGVGPTSNVFGFEALSDLTHRYWDELGYGEPVIELLWEQFEREDGANAVLAGLGSLMRTNQRALRGDLDAIFDLLDRFSRWEPGQPPDFESPDGTRLPAIHLRIRCAAAAIRAAVAAGDEVRATRAKRALDATGVRRTASPIYLFTVASAAACFAWRSVLDEVIEPFERAARGNGWGTRCLAALAEAYRARLANDPARAEAAYFRAADAAEEEKIGAIWILQSLVEAIRARNDRSRVLNAPDLERTRRGPLLRAQRLMASHAVWIFQAALSQSVPCSPWKE